MLCIVAQRYSSCYPTGMETKKKYPALQAAALEVLAGARHSETARKHHVDKGNLSRVVNRTRAQAHKRLEKARTELEFWEEAVSIVDIDNTTC